MYSLLALLGLLVSGAFVQAFVRRRRRSAWVVGAALAALLYTHNWGLFMAAAAAAAYVLLLVVEREDRRAMLVDGAIAFGLPALLYAPWLPTLLFQARHTGAPWSSTPHASSLEHARAHLTGGSGPWAALLVAGAAAAWALWASRRRYEARAAAVLLILGLGTLLLAFGYSQHSPAWASRYLTILVGPVALLGGLAIAWAGVAGLAALAVVAVMWWPQPAYRSVAYKSNVKDLAGRLAPHLRPGDLVVAGQPESGPVLRHYLGPRLRYASATGAVADPGVMDWRDALAHLRASRPAAVLDLAHRLPPGGRVALVRPVTRHGGWTARWTHLVKLRARALARALARDPELRRVAAVPFRRRGAESTMTATVYARR
jgi:hypothetical protein